MENTGIREKCKLNGAQAEEAARAMFSNRHNYFANFPNQLKREARKVLNTKYDSVAQQVVDLFEALKLKPRYTKQPSVNKADCLVSMELDLDYDVCIIATKSEIHTEIINYFRNMLN